MNHITEQLSSFLEHFGNQIKSIINQVDTILLSLILIVSFVYILIISVNWLYNKFKKNEIETVENNEKNDEDESLENELFENKLLESNLFKNELSYTLRNKFESFKKQNLVTPKDFYLFPEGCIHFQNIDWGVIWKVTRSLIKSDETMRRYYGNEVFLEPDNLLQEIDNVLVKIDTIHIIANKLTEVTLTLKNNRLEDLSLNMGISKKTIMKNNSFSLTLDNNNDILFENVSNPEIFKKGQLSSNEEKKFTLFFRTVERGYIKNLNKVDVKVKLKYIKNSSPTEFKISSLIEKDAFPDVVSEFKSQLELDSAQFLLSCGGSLLFLLPISLCIAFIASLFGFVTSIIGFVFAVAAIMFGLNLNARFHQLILDLSKK